MFLERKKEAEVAERKGLARRTVLQTIWLLISLAGAYAVTEYVIFGGEEPLLSIVALTGQLADTFVPPQFHQLVIKIGMIVIVMIVMQTLFFVAYMFGSKDGRQKAGQPTLRSRSNDPYDQQW